MTARRRRWWILVCVALALLMAGMSVAGWLAFRAYAPLLAREQIEAALARALDRPVRIERVLLHPWLRRIVLENVVVASDPDWTREPLLVLERVEASLGISSLWRREVVLSRILLDGITMRATSQSTDSPLRSLLVPDRFAA